MKFSAFPFYLAILCGVGQVACGQKGPPLAPIVFLPRPVTELAVKRVEGDVVVQFKLPTANTDGTAPADLDRVEVYAHTGPLPAPADFLKYGTLVESVKVKPPPEPQEEEEQRAESKETQPGAIGATGLPTVAPPGAEATGAADQATGHKLPATDVPEQGWAITVRETLNAKHMEIGPMPPARAIVPVPGAAPIETLETPGTVNFPLALARYYTVVGVSESRNRRGPYAGPLRVPLIEPLAPVGEVTTSYTPDAVVLSWPGQPEDLAVTAPAASSAAPAADATVPVAPAAPATATDSEPVADPNQETPGTYEIYAAIETERTVDAPLAAAAVAAPSRPQPPSTPRFGYNVYEISATPAPPSAPAQSASADKPADKPAEKPADQPVDKPVAPAPHVPLNTALLTTPSFKDPRVEFGIERCYVVRRVEMASGIPIESAPSAAACVTLVDTFPPPPPASLAHVASGTEVSLIWETSTAPDLAGYLVLRGEAPGDKLAPLTAAPISDASYVDTSVRRNRTYVYEVVAVDKSGNQSAPSNRVEETIR